jgi:hypothetical protein
MMRAVESMKDTVQNTLGQATHGEGRIARTIEEQTAKLPSDLFLWAAVGSIGISLASRLLGKQHTSLFIGQWAPTFLILGLYNKLVKVQGHDRMS